MAGVDGLARLFNSPETYTTSSMNKMWYSKQWDNAPMPHAVFFTKEGHAIHGTYEVKRLGKPCRMAAYVYRRKMRLRFTRSLGKLV